MKGQAKVHRSLQTGSTKSNFERLLSIVNGMKPDEIKTARNYIVFGHQDKFKGAPALLLDFVLQNKNVTYELASEHLGNISRSAFDTIIIRLKERLNYCLVSEFNTMREGAYSEKYKAFFLCKDYLKMIHVLVRRGATQEAYSKILIVIECAEKYEWYESLIEAYYLMLEYYSLVSEYGTFEEIENRIPYFEYCRKSVIKSKMLYDDLMNTNKVTTEGNSIQQYQKTVEHISNLYSKTKSGLILYQLLKIEINKLLQDQQYIEAERKSQELLNHVSNTPSVKQPLTIAVATLHIAECLLMQQCFEESLNYVISARVNLSKNSINYGESLELEFYCLLYLGKAEEAELVMNELLNQSNYAVTLYHRNRRYFLLSCALFAQGKYNEAYDILSDIGYLTRDKAGWNIGIRIYKILLVKLNNDSIKSEYIISQWQREFNSLRKHSTFSKRDAEIFRLLKNLSRSQEAWSRFIKAEANTIDLLVNDDTISWKPGSHEVINVATWLKSKAMNIDFCTYLKQENEKKRLSQKSYQTI